MDRANLALARRLVGRGAPVHLVAHSVDSDLASDPLVSVHLAPCPLHSFALGEFQLARKAVQVAAAVRSLSPRARMLVNGGNCESADLNWVHCVHHAWPCSDSGAPAWFKVKNRLTRRVARARERRSFRAAGVLFANSEKTRRDILACAGIEPERVHTVYLGADPQWTEPAGQERADARAWLACPLEDPVVVFVGALGFDNNKGLDTLLNAWIELCRRPQWKGRLVVAGAGNGLARWRSMVAEAGFSTRVTFLGFTQQIHRLLAAADLLVSPVRYEAYGLNVQEAICRGVPAMVSASAGIAERFPAGLAPMLIDDPDSVGQLVQKINDWAISPDFWRRRFRPFGDELRRHTWEAMADRILQLATGSAEVPHVPISSDCAHE
jgi:glycosyltransferase involved in cell wall biosynthesis